LQIGNISPSANEPSSPVEVMITEVETTAVSCPSSPPSVYPGVLDGTGEKDSAENLDPCSNFIAIPIQENVEPSILGKLK